MVALPTRRAALVAGADSLLALSRDNHYRSPVGTPTVDPSLLADFICTYTSNSFRDAVATTGKFLYRGESNIHRPTILAPEPDLLLEGTYDDPAALVYFQCLEKRLKSDNVLARPSLGHIATTDKSEAAQWGESVTIWPIGGSLSYVWPAREKVFFPAPNTCPSDELAVNHDLAIALELGHEVLFASELVTGDKIPKEFLGQKHESAFLVVPAQFERFLKELVRKPNFTIHQP